MTGPMLQVGQSYVPTEGPAQSAAPGAPPDPSFRNAAYRQQADRWKVCNDVYEGTDAIRRQSTIYLPQNPGETEPKYLRRINRSRFFNAFEPTLHGLVGMVFRKSPVLAEGAGPLVTEHIENIDGRGTHFAIFARELLENALKLGHAGIMVDAPPAPDLGRTPTKADQQALGRRPYWALIRADQIVNFRTETGDNGVTYLALLVIEECGQVADGRFGEKAQTRYRVFERSPAGLVTWQVWTKSTDQSGGHKYLVTGAGIVSDVTDIPFAPLYAGRRVDWLHTKPPLYSLAETNLDHFAVQSDHRYSLHVASVPIPIFKGRNQVNPAQLMGVETGIDIADTATSNAFYLEHHGHALGASRQEQLDLVQRMVSHGLQILAPETRAAETAMAKRIDRAEQDSRLAVAARGLQDCLEQALVFHAQMVGETAADVKVNLDMSGLTLDAQTLVAYTALVVANKLTDRTLWSIMQDGGALPEDFDPDVEEEALAQQALLDRASSPLLLPNPNADLTNPHAADGPMRPDPASQAPIANAPVSAAA